MRRADLPIPKCITGGGGRGGLTVLFGGPVPIGRPRGLEPLTVLTDKLGLWLNEDAGVGADVASGEDEREEDEPASRLDTVEESRSFDGTRD